MDSKTFQLKLLSPEETFFEGEVVKLRLKTDDGEIEIYPHHASLVSTLRSSMARVYLPDSRVLYFALRDGIVFVEQEKNIVNLSAFSCIKAEEVKLESLLEYKESILKQMKEGNLVPLQVRFLENQSESLTQMVEVIQEKYYED